MTNHGLTVDDADRLLDKIIDIPEQDITFERLRSITDFRKDDNEARILYICRRKQSASHASTGESHDELFVLKCKIQAPSVLAGGLTTPIEGPSEYTKDELKALTVFRETHSPGLPHLVASKIVVQDERGPMPGGYLAYVVMTLMPGRDVFDLKFWSMSDTEKETIRDEFIVALKRVWKLGFEPYDCALRNILWEAETRTLSLVDFEHWRPTTKDPINMTEREELQRWGLVHRPPPRYHWQEWVYNGTF